MPIGAKVSRIRTEQIFRECWNLITPGYHARRFGSALPGGLASCRGGGFDPATFRQSKED
jgi:hypothetical protein